MKFFGAIVTMWTIKYFLYAFRLKTHSIKDWNGWILKKNHYDCRIFLTPLSGSTTLGLLLINTKGQNNFPVELTHDFFWVDMKVCLIVILYRLSVKFLLAPGPKSAILYFHPSILPYRFNRRVFLRALLAWAAWALLVLGL